MLETGRTSPWSTSGCRRRSPTRACGPRSRPAASPRAAGARALPVRRAALRPRTARRRRGRRRLPAQGPGVDGGQFTDAVRRVADGGTVDGPEVIAKLLPARAPTSRSARLSPREREVLEQMAEGRSNAAIAQRLVVTERASPSTPPRSSPSSTCSRPKTTTAVSSPSSPTWASSRRKFTGGSAVPGA